MALTRVSPALFQVSNNITSVTVGGSANTISLTFDSNGVITGASNNALLISNTAITGNIISSQITSVANTQITGNIASSQITSNPTLYGNVSVTGVIGVGGATTSTSGSGISFPATQSASSDANTLDDYEEGTWTPDVRAGGSSTWTQKNGYYRKVGSLVNAYFVCDGNNSGTSGNLTLYGLPFALGSVAGFVTFGIWSANSLSVPNGGFSQNSTGATSLNVYTGGSHVSGQAGYMSGMICYYTA